MRAENRLDEKSADLWRHLWPEVSTASVAHFGQFGCNPGGRLGSKVKKDHSWATAVARHNTNFCLLLVGQRHAFAHVAHQDFSPKKKIRPETWSCMCVLTRWQGRSRAEREEEEGREGGRGIMFFQWFCAPRDQRPCVMTFCLKVWSKTPNPLFFFDDEHGITQSKSKQKE